MFIANTDSGIEPFSNIDGLHALAGKRFTFESESSTSGRLMPQHFMISLHDPPQALAFCERIVGLRQGRILFDRSSASVTDADIAALYQLEVP